MTTKLTLSMDEKAIQRGKQYAHSTGRSLSRIVEDYLTQLGDMQSSDNLSAGVAALIGIGQGSADENDYRSHLEKKHA